MSTVHQRLLNWMQYQKDTGGSQFYIHTADGVWHVEMSIPGVSWRDDPVRVTAHSPNIWEATVDLQRRAHKILRKKNAA